MYTRRFADRELLRALSLPLELEVLPAGTHSMPADVFLRTHSAIRAREPNASFHIWDLEQVRPTREVEPTSCDIFSSHRLCTPRTQPLPLG